MQWGSPHVLFKTREWEVRSKRRQVGGWKRVAPAMTASAGLKAGLAQARSQDSRGGGATIFSRGAMMAGIYAGGQNERISLEKHQRPETPPNFTKRK